MKTLDPPKQVGFISTLSLISGGELHLNPRVEPLFGTTIA